MDPTAELNAIKTSSDVASLEKKPEAPSPEQLRVLAAQFEAMLMGQMLKQMQSAMFGDDDEKSGFASGPLGDALYSDLAGALSRSGGFGLADSLVAPLMRQTAALDTVKAGGLDVGQILSDLPFTADPKGLALPTEGLPFTASPAAPAIRLDGPTSLGPISSAFGWRQDPFSKAEKFHQGTDIRMPIGQDVPVAQSGRVTFAGDQRGYGLTVMVEHAPGLVTRYAHLSKIEVEAGDEVALGQTIAKSGASGRATGPHLHFEVIEGGNPVDPALGLARLGTSVQKVE